jgi:DNA-binding IclR family transcriptional regulator
MNKGKIRVNTLKKFLELFNLRREKNRPLTVAEISQAIGCCKSHAYNYSRALEKLFSALLS